jgi:hypothetical protein
MINGSEYNSFSNNNVLPDTLNSSSDFNFNQFYSSTGGKKSNKKSLKKSNKKSLKKGGMPFADRLSDFMDSYPANEEGVSAFGTAAATKAALDMEVGVTESNDAGGDSNVVEDLYNSLGGRAKKGKHLKKVNKSKKNKSNKKKGRKTHRK